MRSRYIVLTVITVALALGCFRLSKWQVDRLAQRRARNAMLAARLENAPAVLSDIPADTSLGHYRRVHVSGAFDYDRQVALALRSRDGSPGVYVLTPLRLTDGRTALANRGWVYAADGMSVDLTPWREGDAVDAEGFLETFVPPRGPVTMEGRPALVRQLVLDSLAQRVAPGTTLFPYVVVITKPASPSAPARLAPPSLSEGSHLSYAIQWGAFGIIAVVGTFLAVRRGIAERRSAAVAPFGGAGVTLS
jgi:surfeit locus 1 family protein